ncbi:ABC-2 type transport system permease protein [Actinokineospora alba]|uniref:ABC-2 type transport system permease protein n=1 Tax=Actinokineospora alba TaxID=504798 RepID=A0A1H0FTP8_9PSEU|nr:ABC transporter permease [Actinokineospora alba]TDP69612.1 ABC-2 type transport system permease protein [Actinokineospora alba]SDI12957.1 ABC-2 type transport system permease protein [Actinokineospora alba]SDN98020.1 ABC-2 type transport system permease protein [Actinokineospora alba]
MLDVLGAEIGKGLRIQLAHPVGHVITLLISTTMYLGLQFVLGQGELRQDLLPQTLVAIGGYWFLQYAALVMVSDLIEEKRAGTFAQAQMTSAPPWVPMLGRLITASVFGLAVAAVAAVVPMLVAGIAVPVKSAALVPALLLGINALAFTFLLAAIALVSPMIGALQSLFTALVLLLNGSFLPLAFYPDWLGVLARFLPTTLGVEATTQALFEGRTLAEVWSGGALPWLIAHTVALAVISGLLFVRNHRRALREPS